MIKTGNRNFWIAQLIGWGLFAFVNFLVQYAAISAQGTEDSNLWPPLLNSSVAFLGGLIVTSSYRYIIKKRRLNLLKIGSTLLYISASTVILTLVFLVIVNLFMALLMESRFLTTIEFLGNFFIFGILMLIWNSLYFMVHYLHSWKNAESEKWQLSSAMKAAELGHLKSQLNPHFTFNSINNIRALISLDPEKAKDMLLHFSDLLRYSLVHNDQKLVSITEELEIVEKYLELSSIQFGDKLQYRIELDPDIGERKVPPMMIQLLVENAIKHGISELREGGEVLVYISENKSSLNIKVVNSGKLSTNGSIQGKLGIGIQNIKDRLEILYGEGAELDIYESNGAVTAVINIPNKQLNLAS